MSTTLRPHPIAAIAAFVAAICGTMAARDPATLALFWLAVIIPLTTAERTVTAHAGYLFAVVLPVGIVSAAVWGWLVGAPPGVARGTNPGAGLEFAMLIALRLAVLGGLMQGVLLPIPASRLVSAVARVGIRGDTLLIIAGSVALLPEMRLRADQVLTARYARGLLSRRGIARRLGESPRLVRPLLAWSLRSAIQRARHWEQRGIRDQLSKRRGQLLSPANRFASWMYIFVGVAWMAYNVVRRLHG